MSLLTGKITKPRAKVQPSSKDELEKLIDDKIKCVNPKPGDKVCFNWIDISEVDDLSYLFANVDYIPVVDTWLAKEDNSKVKKNMRCMFACSKFNVNISGWDVSKVTDMRGMFAHSNFNGDISGWKDKVKNVKDMRWMFDGCPLENNPPEWYNEKR